MDVNLDLPPLGAMHAKVSLAGSRVDTVIWAEERATLDLMRAHVDWLQSQLEAAGLEATPVQCLAGKPVRNHSPAATEPLVDIAI